MYYARDVQELSKVEKRTGFLKLFEIILQQSGGIFDAVTLAKSSGLSRPTVLTYLEVFQLTHVAHILRPYHGGGKQEIVKHPKGRNLIVTHSQREVVTKKVDGMEIVSKHSVMAMPTQIIITASAHFANSIFLTRTRG